MASDINTNRHSQNPLLGMRALSVRQPWAWLILHAGKDIENRNWRTNFRGRVLVHASKGMTSMEYESAAMFLTTCIPRDIILPAPSELQRGGIIGAVDITGCFVKHHSPWFTGFYGFALANPEPLEFIPCRGDLSFFRPSLKAKSEKTYQCPGCGEFKFMDRFPDDPVVPGLCALCDLAVRNPDEPTEFSHRQELHGNND
jgi:hypothetical protein